MTIFGIVRVVLAAFGALLVVQALFGVPYALADGAWGPAVIVLLGGILGVWLFRVGLHGTFSGQPPDVDSHGDNRSAGLDR